MSGSVLRRRPRRRSLAGVLALALLATTGCIAIIHDDASSVGPHCRFGGDDTTACGKCIADSCQSEVDDCCKAGSSCDYAMSEVDQCGRGGSDYACSGLYYYGGGSSSPSTAQKLDLCVTASCGVTCGFVDGGTDDGSAATLDASAKDTGSTSCASRIDRSSTCGRCIDTYCSSYIDATCCADTSCSGVVDVAARCIATQSCSTCTSLYFDGTPRTPDENLMYCISVDCLDSCVNLGCP